MSIKAFQPTVASEEGAFLAAGCGAASLAPHRTHFSHARCLPADAGDGRAEFRQAADAHVISHFYSVDTVGGFLLLHYRLCITLRNTETKHAYGTTS